MESANENSGAVSQTPYRHVRMDLLTSKQVQQYLEKNDMVILPVGCFEMHGPNLPLACDAYTEWAADILLADKWKCLTLPPIFFSYPGGTGPWPGSADISPEATYAYVKAVVRGMLRNGFKRVIISGGHAPIVPILQSAVYQLYHESGDTVMHLNIYPIIMPDDLVKEEFGMRWGEDMMLLAAFRILGMHGAYDPQVDIAEDKSPQWQSEGVGKLKQLCGGITVPSVFSEDHRHAGIRKGLTLADADRAVSVMKKAVERLKDLPALFAEYQAELKQLEKNKPWNSTNWSI